MRTIYVDRNGVSDADTPIQDGEIAVININDQFAVTVIGSANSGDFLPCLSCPFGPGDIGVALPRCPRLQYLGDDGYEDYDRGDYDQYDYLCQGVCIKSVSDVLGEL